MQPLPERVFILYFMVKQTRVYAKSARRILLPRKISSCESSCVSFNNRVYFQIAVLYVAGFASSLVFGTATGPMADIVGRKKVAFLFCILYTFCCLTKLSSSYGVLMLGRILGGISTSMLFSTFESWYVYEHAERHGFPSEWIGITFSYATFWNGVLAILAGVISNFTAEGLGYGPVAPFVVATVPLTLGGLLILKTWPENYGQRSHDLSKSCIDGFKAILADRNVLLLGCIQTAVESCMYIFVFLWTPVMAPINPPLGMVFASFMVAIMIGSSLFSILQEKGYRAQDILLMVLMTISGAMATCAVVAGPDATMTTLQISFGAFLVLEVAIGMYFPAMSYAKSQVIPESHRAGVMNWFRVPMNLITCTTLMCLHIEWVADDKRTVFGACMILAILGILAARKFRLTVTLGEKSHEEPSKQILIENEES